MDSATLVSFKRKCAHHAAEKIGPLKWLMQWDIVNLYCLRLKVCGGEQRAQVILFEEAKYLLGCNVQDYIESTLVCFERKCAYHAAEKTGPSNGLCNGTWLICRGFEENVIHAEKTI
ncbi:hypothetical protein H5410_041007, partial [Solanum commersonii]